MVIPWSTTPWRSTSTVPRLSISDATRSANLAMASSGSALKRLRSSSHVSVWVAPINAHISAVSNPRTGSKSVGWPWAVPILTAS